MTTTKILLTQTLVVNAPLPASGEDLYHDTKQRGLSLRVWPGGSKTFVLRRKFNNESKKRTIGSHPDWTVDMARKEAARWTVAWDQGVDPYQERKKVAEATAAAHEAKTRTFDVVYKQWVEKKRKQVKPTTHTDQLKILRWLGGEAATDQPDATRKKQRGGEKKPMPKPAKLWRTPFVEVTRDLVEQAMTPYLDTPATAKKIYAYCSAAYKSEAGRKKLIGNPFEEWFKESGLKPPKPRPGHLDLDKEAAKTWLRAAVAARNSSDFQTALQADYLLCVLFWGTRATETASLRVENVFLSGTVERKPWAVFVQETTKTARAHYFPLTPWACEVLRGRIEKNGARNADGWVFPSREEGKHLTSWGVRRLLDRVNEEAGLKIKLHDLRRTLASDIAESSNYNLALVKLALNHSTGDVTEGYVMQKPKIEGLRAPFLKRERRLKQIVGIEAAPAELSIELLAALADPSQRVAVLEALGL